MKTLLRTFVLTAALALTALIPSRAITLGTCNTICATPGVLRGTTVSWSSTLAQCCGQTSAPCPAGTYPRSSIYYYPFPGGEYVCLQ